MKSLLFAVLGALSFAGPSFAGKFTLSSKSIADGKVIDKKFVFNSFGCTGDNKSPELTWTKGPAGTKFYAITAYDPDAPTGSGWWHWLIVNIPESTTSLAEGVSGDASKLPAGSLETRTDYGKAGYGGPCPPAGDKPHRYIFTVYAVKDKIPVEADASGALAGYYIQANKLAEAKLTGKFGR